MASMHGDRRPVNEWAHDLRSPLTGISGFASLIGASDDLDSIHRWAEKIVSASGAMEALIEEMAASDS